ncbi:MAG TPA: hypothetical protein VFF33_13445 [Ignavibacteriaceae bacterium]|nr:hypothetical protein [Ignavibacteriaceae bacterium]
MSNIEKIIAAIDQYLEKNNKEYMTAVAANAYLDKIGLLKDSSTKPGLPLRKIPHAYQVGVNWRIPHSGNKEHQNLNIILNNKKNLIETKSNIKLEDLMLSIKKAREKYKPDVIKCVLIAEAPPDAIERFFYYEDVREKDFLFLGVMEVLYPKLKEDYLSSGRNILNKKKMLEKFMEDGFYLLDLFDGPISLYIDSERCAAKQLTEELTMAISKDIPVIMIKANVYEILYHQLKGKGFNVIDVKIPFPSTGNQGKFREKFKDTLKKLNL